MVGYGVVLGVVALLADFGVLSLSQVGGGVGALAVLMIADGLGIITRLQDRINR